MRDAIDFDNTNATIGDNWRDLELRINGVKPSGDCIIEAISEGTKLTAEKQGVKLVAGDRLRVDITSVKPYGFDIDDKIVLKHVPTKAMLIE